jgi:tetratricopeptide (TPR) repeat protein
VRAFATGALLAAILGAAFWTGSGGSISPEVAKRGFLLAVGCAAIPILLCGWRSIAAVPTWALALLAADLALHALSAMFALDSVSAWFGGVERGLGVADAAAWSLIALLSAKLSATPGTSFSSIVRTALAVASALAGIALLQAFVDWRTAPEGFPIQRPYATLGNPSFLAGVLAMALPVALAARIRPLAKLACALPILAALLLTQSRGALLAAIVGSSLTLVLIHDGSRRRLILLLSGLMITAAAIGWTAMVIKRPDSVAIRAALYQAAVDAQLHPATLIDVRGMTDPVQRWRPWIGYGPDNIEPVLTRHRDASINRYEAQGWDRLADRSHDRLLDRWIELGWPGAALGLALAGLPMIRGIRLSRREIPGSASLQCQRLCIASACGCWLAFGIDGLFGVPNAALDLAGAVALGVLIAPWPNPEPGTNSSQHREPDSKSAPVFSAWLMILTATIVTTGLALAVGRSHQENTGLPSASSGSTNFPCAANRTSLRFSALPSLRALDSLHGSDPELGTPGIDKAECLRAAEHITRAAPTLPRGWYLLGWLRQRTGDEDGARQAYLQALTQLQQAQARSVDSLTGAIEKISAAERIQPENPNAARQLLQQARSEFEAQEESTRNALWYRNYAFLRARQGAVAAAVRAYHQAVLLAPDDQASQRNLKLLEAQLESGPAPD